MSLYQENLMMVQHLFFPDAPVHPPVSETHPYDNLDPNNMPADTGYGCQMVGGVAHVYTKKTNMDKYAFMSAIQSFDMNQYRDLNRK